VPVRVLANKHGHEESDLASHLRAHGSRRRFGAGFARNTAAEQASAEILAFLDDDAAADPDWLAQLLSGYGLDPTVLAVGGAPIPDYQTQRPPWMPEEFNWVFGCAYRGLPTERRGVRHLIGANMSVRASALKEIGGFHSIDFDDLDMCLRLAALRPPGKIIYEPRARVRHFVGAERVTWSYFWRRCFFVNKHKVRALTAMKSAASLAAERRFVVEALRSGTVLELRMFVKGDKWAAARLGSMLLGIGLAGLGNGAGRVEEYRRRGLAR
jgi:GT2 family glycosyltransferase